MGLFDNISDPNSAAQLAMALGLLGSQRRPGQNQLSALGDALGQGGLLAMRQYQLADEARRRNQGMQMQNDMRAAQLAEMKRKADYNSRFDALAGNYFDKGYQPSTPVDELGIPIQPVPPKADFAGFVGALPSLGGQGVKDAIGLQQMVAKESPLDKFKPEHYTPESLAKFGQSRNPADLVPAKPQEKAKFQPGDIRSYDAGRVKITEEYQPNGSWKRIGSSAIDKQDTGLPKPPFGWEYAPDGSIIATRGGPHDPRTVAKTDATAIAKNEAKSRVDSMLDQLEGNYQTLLKSGDAVSTALPARTNIQNRLAASETGQLLGSAVGTKAQSIRNNIRQTIPLLMNEIRSATGMSAKAMDSNAELQFYLRAATDPTMDVEANLKAIKALREMYGTGAGKSQPQSGATVSNW